MLTMARPSMLDAVMKVVATGIPATRAVLAVIQVHDPVQLVASAHRERSTARVPRRVQPRANRPLDRLRIPITAAEGLVTSSPTTQVTLATKGCIQWGIALERPAAQFLLCSGPRST